MLVRLVLAGLAGGVAALAFEPFAYAVALPVAIALLAGMLASLPEHHAGRRGYLLATVFGAVFMLTLLPWLHVVTPLWPLIALAEAPLIGLTGLAAAYARRPWWPLVVAAIWTTAEVVRSTWPLGGFPWGRVGFGVADSPFAGLLPWVGVTGTTFVVALLGAALGWAVVTVRVRPVPAVATTLGALALATAGAWLPLDPAGGVRDESALRVAAVQGNTPGVGLSAMAERRQVLDNHVRATQDLAAAVRRGAEPAPDLVLWPENSSDIDPFTDAAAYADVAGAAVAVDAPLVMGTAVSDGVGWRNRFQLWEADGRPTAYYDKRKAVPFGEYVPFRAVLDPIVPALEQIPRDMLPGDRPGVMELADVPVGVITCYEVAYAPLVTDLVDSGARLLAVPTNNATYMGTAQVEQQFAMARLTALATSRSVVVVSTNGVSGLVAPDGSVVERAPVRTTHVLTADVSPRVGLTPAVRWATVWTVLFTVPGAVLALAALLVLRRGRRTPAPLERVEATA
ncbi:apolipoprotein N-acyltransferase [Nocardioides massiliensis]|uniref:Apolipoprotein N-acyltransferase n=1 Tax=Nocardioides massiliensis TaxID=1325935 RepID=A0ABT9NRH3_9ACTN|nr:apolipoprotein N-acyltransferase [Nocardioides massiliensis]MDP9823003.1 apolipoprotein N-acyltransferase [Nocardioides massiliensis]